MQEQLKKLGDGWSITQHENKHLLVKTFEFKAYFKALSFVQLTGWLAQKSNHHPDITLTFSKVKIELTTHDAGNMITEKDWEFATKIEAMNF